MNGFVVQSPAPSEIESIIKSMAFWPDVDPVKIRVAHRIDGTVTPDRLRDVLIESVANVNTQLAAWHTLCMANGANTLDEVPAEHVDNTSILTHRYLRAVGCYGKALLLERYRDFDTTAAGNKKADQLENPIDDLRRDARWAVSDLLGIGRSTIELI
jgi:Phage head completion protein (GPL)